MSTAAQDPAIRCMLLPLNGRTLLIPNAVLAEVISYSEPDHPVARVDWLTGRAAWRGVNVPLVAVERALGLGEPGEGHRAQVAILYGVGAHGDCPYWGLRLQGIPRSVLLTGEGIEDLPGEPGLELVRGEVRVGEEAAVVPDLPAIEQAIAAALEAGPDPE